MSLLKLFVPFLGTNDDSAVVLSVTSLIDKEVSQGIELLTVETTKAAITISAPCSGYFYPLVNNGDRVIVDQLVGVISLSPIASGELEALILEAKAAVKQTKPRFTVKGGKLADFLRIRHELEESLEIGELIDTKTIENYLETKLSLLSTESRRLISSIKNSIDLFIFGNGHGNHAISRHMSEIKQIRRIVLFDYSNKAQPDHGKFGIELPIWTAYELVKSRSPCLVHVPYEILSLIRDHLVSIEPDFISFIHPASSVGNTAKIGKSSVVMAGAVIEPDANIGNFCFVGANAVIGSEVTIGDGAMILNSSSVAHNSIVGEGSLLADGSRVGGRVQLGHNVRLGLNSSVNAGVCVTDGHRLKSNGIIS